jgi:hypothetical protein
MVGQLAFTQDGSPASSLIMGSLACPNLKLTPACAGQKPKIKGNRITRHPLLRQWMMCGDAVIGQEIYQLKIVFLSVSSYKF